MAERALDTSQILRTRAGVSVQLLPMGGLAAESLAEIGAGLEQLIRDRDVDIIVDVVRAKTISSAALETLLDFHDSLRANGGRLRVTNPSSIVSEVLCITGTENSIGVVRAANSDEAPAPLPAAKQRLGDILVARELLTEDRLQEALVLQKEGDKRLGEIVLEKGWVAEVEVLRALSQQISVPEVSLRPGVFDPEISDLIDARTIRRLKVYPLFKVRNELTLATTNPQNSACLREVESLTGCSVRPVLATLGDILGLIDESSGEIALSMELMAEVDDDFEVVESTVDDLDAAGEGAANPIINLANSLIQRAVREGASDVHIEAARDKCRIRFRIDGVLYEVMTLRPELRPALVSRLKVMADLDISERRLPQDGRIQVITQGRSVDLRFSSLPGLYGEKVVLRVLDKNRTILELDKLGMRAQNRATYGRLLECGFGLILVTGPTGSGTTTSLYAALNHMNSLDRNIVTIEDPVEYQLDIVNQNEVRPNIGLTFATMLKHVLRQDPDI
ncbi:MAG: ATPase, T2SS/T4P/T4SS family, partial [Gammaproteobacteria bacterium]|nr:ATPase, T2SS/T4P/T4SS family [Gammaproteobacteria bacterium]